MINVKDRGEGLFEMQISIPEVHTLDVPDLKEKIQQFIMSNNVKKLVLDLSLVKMITSSGIGIFLNINQILKSQLKLAAPGQEVRKVLELTKVASIIEVFETVDMAVKSLK